ncbi:MAG: ATP-binding cassette domain-containing protein [Pseudomonadales bacterium]|nr:ATP-binding cassette domain-containing protein [Pseudomonadales bacterium]
MSLLEIKDLAVSFRTEAGRLQVLRSVGLEVDRGETLAVVGESGSGKSVTALSILQLLGEAGRIDSGQIIFDGQDLAAFEDADMRAIRGNRISMIFQEPMSSLNPVIPIGKQVAEPLVLHKALSWRDGLLEAESLLRKVAIPDPAGRLSEYPHQLSGGMRQRVMIAMALACSPKLIIADEPTTALDVTVQAQILGLLKELTRETGAALILITHDLGVVARYADHVSVMYAGQIVESAPAPKLYKNPHHPYTQGLMASIPALDGEVDARLATIEGQPPDLAQTTKGCPFAPRCNAVQPACHLETPPLEAIDTNHLKACFVR